MHDTNAGTLGTTERARIAWHISTFSDNGGGNCVEAGPLADGSDRVAVRHSQRPDAELIVYTRAEWEAFTAGVRNGEFDFFA
ncbi:DUF397 domain-containing protein [Actinomadura atramentaria]|uniref:DUF397 domain-containing protein n=1 Tax=Actinomadura atramentaria TaxID=1990 RepID=UPI00037E0A87|nr:DUF397 domain-containing protein [Actinomadura atramentaria]